MADEPVFKENDNTGKASTITFKAWYSLAILFATCIILLVVNLGVSKYVADQSYKRSQAGIDRAIQNQKNFCALMVTLDQAYSSEPPPTATGKLIASEIHALVSNLGC